MTPITDDNPSVEDSHEMVSSELCQNASRDGTLSVKTKEFKDKQETNQENSRNNSSVSSHLPHESAKLLERKVISQESTAKQNGDRRENKVFSSSQPDVSEQETVAPDGGWGWVVLGGCVYATMLLTSIGMCFGIEFGPLMKSFGMSATAISWAFNMHTFTWSLTMPVTAPLCRCFGWRRVGLCSSFVAAISYIALAFAFSPAYIFFFFSFFFSASVGVTHNITQLILPAYFERHRGLALGLNVTGVAIGQMVMPQVVRLLQAEYGFLGATLIHAGLFLNVCVATALFRPIKKKMRKVDKHRPKSPPLVHKEILSIRELSKKELMLGDSTQSLNVMPLETTGTDSQLPREISGFRQIVTEIATNVKNSAAALKKFKVLICALGFSFFILGYVNFIMMIPFAMVAEGHSLQSAAWCMSGAALSNFCSRLAMSFLADRTWFNIRRTFMAGSVITSFFCFSFVFTLPNLTWVMVCMLGWGVGLGFIMALWVVLLIETVGIDEYVLGMGANSLVMAVSYITAGPVFGMIRDASTNYSSSLSACAALQLSTALLWLLMPCAVRADNRREREAQKDVV